MYHLYPRMILGKQKRSVIVSMIPRIILKPSSTVPFESPSLQYHGVTTMSSSSPWLRPTFTSIRHPCHLSPDWMLSSTRCLNPLHLLRRLVRHQTQPYLRTRSH